MRIVKHNKINSCTDIDTNNAFADTIPCEEPTTYVICRDLLSQAINVLGNDATTNDIARDILVDLSVVLLELDGLN